MPVSPILSFSLSLQSERVENPVFVSPAFLYFDKEFEVTPMANQVFDVTAGGDTNGFQAFGALSDDDLLLAGAFDEDRTVDAGKVRSFLVEFFSYNRSHIRNFFPGGFKDFFADHFRNQHSDGL